ncbi:hypothetical protein J4G37_55815, partial [Microvirga sp. 3-52]|nr:hypothetical protein [Microvirga sp. 3-52]
LTEINDDQLHLRADQLLLSFPESHPYVKFEGQTKEDDQTLQSIREAADAWRNPKIWNYVETNETGIHFNTDEISLTDAAVQIIQSAVYGRLIDSSLSPEQLPTLLPHLRKYGW